MIIGLSVIIVSLSFLVLDCFSFECLVICMSDIFGDFEFLCIVYKCLVLKKFCIKGCFIFDWGMEVFVVGCFSFVKMKVKKCRVVILVGVVCFYLNRVFFVVIFDVFLINFNVV